MILEEEESKRLKDYVVQKVQSIKNPRIIYTVEKWEYK